MNILVKRVLSNAKLPRFALSDDAGMDLFSCEAINLMPGNKLVVRTGIALQIPVGFVGLIWDKSGVASKGIKTMGGVIDSGYRGEIKVLLTNLGNTVYEIKDGDKIAQILIQKVERPAIQEVDFLEDSERGVGGFGSTGKR